MAYTVLTLDALTKWWITGTGSVVNRLSECMDDFPLGPAIQTLDAANAWTAGTGNEWYDATPTKPDTVQENLAGWRSMTAAGDDTDGSLAVDTWCFDTGNNRVYIRLSDDSDPNATDVRKHYAWDGSGAGSAFMTEHIEDELYQIHISLEVGNGTTATTLTSVQEYVTFDSGKYVKVKANATLTLGELYGDYGINGSMWKISASSWNAFCDGGTINIYASLVRTSDKQRQLFYTGTVVIKNSILEANYYSDSAYQRRIEFWTSSCDLDKVYFNNVQEIAFYESPTSMKDVHVHRAAFGIEARAVGIEVNGPLFSSIGTADIYVWTNNAADDFTVECIDPKEPLSTVSIVIPADNDFWIKETYTCNVTVCDKDGTLLDGVEVLCEDQADATVWTTTTGDTDTGKIDEQQINYKQWIGPDETLTTNSPHVFTLSKAGYETLILENVTVDAPIAWHLELGGKQQITVGGNDYFSDDS